MVTQRSTVLRTALALFAGPAQLRARVQKLLRRAVRTGYVGSEYQKQNEDEFFACTYTEYLARRYGLDAEQELDDRGVGAEILALFEELEASAEPLSESSG